MLFIGLDISLRATAICVLTQAGEIVWQGKALSDPEGIVTWSPDGRDANAATEAPHNGARTARRH